jgi:nucleotide-binding universal stress UspA family protein
MTDTPPETHESARGIRTAERYADAVKKALIAVKDSRASLHAFCEALALSRLLGVHLAAVSVAPLYEGDLSMTVAPMRSARNEPFQTVLDEALRIAESQKVGLQTYLATGPVDKTILDLARDGGFDLIILGRNTGWTLPGDVAARVIRHSRSDVLVIPEKCPLRLDHISCYADGAMAASAQARAMQLARHCNARLTLLSDQDLHRILKDRSDDVGFLVLGETWPSGLWSVLRKSMTLRFLRLAGHPILVVKHACK